MRFSGVFIGICTTVFCCANAEAAQRDVSTLQLTIDDWVLVPTMLGTQVETIAAFRDPQLSTGQNVTTVWFVRKDQRQWEVLAWEEQNNRRAVGHIKTHLALSDDTDSKWPAVALIGNENDPETDPKRFALGVFEDDPYAAVLNLIQERGPLLTALTQSGWQAARIAIWSTSSNCTRAEILSSLAGRIEADIALEAGGTLVSSFAVPAADCNEYISLEFPLNSAGQWAVPDFTTNLDEIIGAQPASAWQATQAGTLVTGPQTLVMEVGGVDQGTPYTSSRLVITLKDRTGPTVTIAIQGNGTAGFDSPSGLKYFIAPADISANWTAIDNVDGPIASTGAVIDVDCEVVEANSPAHITSPGLYTLRGTFRDAAGNSTFVAEMFEVRNSHNYKIETAINSLTITSGQELDFVEAEVLLAGGPNPACEFAPASVEVWLLDQDGNAINEVPLRAAPDAIVNGQYNSSRIGFDLCVLRLSVQGYVPADALASGNTRYFVTGSGLDGEPGAFDFITEKNRFTETEEAAETLSAFAPSQNCNCQTPSPPPPCQWKWQFIPDDPPVDMKQANYTHGCTIYSSCSGVSAGLYAAPHIMEGAAYAWDTCPVVCTGEHWDEVVASGGILKVWLSGTNCCQNCEIDALARLRFKAHVDIDPWADAAALGELAVAIPGCGNIIASGGAAVNSHDSGNVTLSSPFGGVTIPYVTSELSDSDAPSAQSACTPYPHCSITIQISTKGRLHVNVESSILNQGAQAFAHLYDTMVKVEVTPTTIPPCTAIGNGVPITLRHCIEPQPLP